MIDQFLQQCAALAQQAGIASLVVVVRDPQSGEAKLVASNGAMQDLRMTVAEKFGLSDSDPEAETGWPS